MKNRPFNRENRPESSSHTWQKPLLYTFSALMNKHSLFLLSKKEMQSALQTHRGNAGGAADYLLRDGCRSALASGRAIVVFRPVAVILAQVKIIEAQVKTVFAYASTVKAQVKIAEAQVSVILAQVKIIEAQVKTVFAYAALILAQVKMTDACAKIVAAQAKMILAQATIVSTTPLIFIYNHKTL